MLSRSGTVRSGLRQVLLLLAGLGLLGPMVSVSRGDDQPNADLKAQLAAGEFAPAIAAAQQAADPKQRDAMLAQVAAAQVQAGAPAAAVNTVAHVGDDRLRANILAGVGAGGAGAGAGAAGPNNPNGANFEALETLITSTVATKSWQENGGTGTISHFPTGVWVDPQGMLRPLMREARSGDLAALRTSHQQRAGGDRPGTQPAGSALVGDARHSSPLRMISLTRLEKQMEVNAALGQVADESIQYLAGLRRIEYVFVYPETGDLVVAGPAGDWTVGAENRVVSCDTGDPVVRLDDLVVVFRHMMSGRDAHFGCMINPRQESLKKAQEFLNYWGKRKLREGAAARKEYCEQLRAAVGKQDVEVFGGLDPQTRAARTLVEADYRMKLVGMGLEEGVPGVRSYMSLIKSPPKEMSTLRWWFTLNYDSIQTSQDHLAFNIRGQGVKVESENEHLTALGERVHTGESEPLNRQFTESFTKHFDEALRQVSDLCRVAEPVRPGPGCFAGPRGRPGRQGGLAHGLFRQSAGVCRRAVRGPQGSGFGGQLSPAQPGRVCGAGQRRRGSEDQRAGQSASDQGREFRATPAAAAGESREAPGDRPLVVGLSPWSAVRAARLRGRYRFNLECGDLIPLFS